MTPRGRKLYHIALLAFSLCSIIPLLIFVYLLVQKGILDYPLAALCVVMGLGLSVLGYLFLRSGFEVLSRLAKSLGMSMEAPGAGVDFQQELSGKVFEADEILGAFRSTTERLEKSVAKVEVLNNRFALVADLVHISSCSIEPGEMAQHYIKRLIRVTASTFGVVTYLEDKELVKVMAALPGSSLSVDVLQMLNFNTQRVFQTKNPYLGCNFCPRETPVKKAKDGPLVSWPISHRGDVMAVLHIGRGPDSAEFNPEDFKTMGIAADLFGLTLDNLRRLRADSLFAGDREESEPEREGEEDAPPAGAGILVVDDEPVVRDMLGKFLRDRGYGVHCVSSGEEAMSILEESEPPVILLGLKLKDMDSIEVLKKIHRDRPETGVVIIAGEIAPEVFNEARELGVLDCLVRPIDFNYLENLLLIKMPDPHSN